MWLTVKNYFPYLWRSALLLTLMAIGLIWVNGRYPCPSFGCYIFFLAFFHFSEFVTIAISNRPSLSVSSFLFNHSPEYNIASIASWVEFSLEWYLVPWTKQISWIINVGIIMCVTGEFIRKLAMLTAGISFNHLVEYKKRPEHTLVTRGIYSFCRHPSYVGWFYWSIGTQLILCNPICALAYACVAWKFFDGRIALEEEQLIRFFGSQYISYKSKVPSGLPFIS